MHFLRAYCQRTLSSGKIIRTVPKLNAIVQGAFDQSVEQRTEPVRDRLDNEQQADDHGDFNRSPVPVNAVLSES